MTPAKNVTTEAKFGSSLGEKLTLWRLFAREDLRNGWIIAFLAGCGVLTVLARAIPPIIAVNFIVLWVFPIIYAMAANRLGAGRFRGAMARVVAQADRAGKSAFPLEILLGQIFSFAILTAVSWVYLTLALRWNLADPVLRYFLADMAVMGFLALAIGARWPERPFAALFSPAIMIVIFYFLSSVVRRVFVTPEFQFRFSALLVIVAFIVALSGLRRHAIRPRPPS